MNADALRVQVDGETLAIELLAGGGAPASPRLVLPRAAAQALLRQLEQALGPAQADPLDALLRQGVAPALLQQGRQPVNAPADAAGAAADRLLKAVHAMGAPVRQERSLRLVPGAVQAHRFLLTVRPQDLPGDARAAVAAVGTAMQMPPAVAQWLQAAPSPAAVHFGFEGDGARAMCKLYLERPAEPTAGGEPVLLHEACKWTLGEPGHVVSRYHWHPGLDADAIAQRLQALYEGRSAAARELAAEVARRAAARAPQPPPFLEVTEEGNARASFDLNLYDADMAVRDLQDVLAAMRDELQVPPGRWQVLYDQVKGRRLGHVAGGTHRDGAPFFTLYVGAPA